MTAHPSAQPAVPTDSVVSTLATIGVVFGAASTIAALIISGYLAIAMAIIGLPMAFVARSKGAGSNGLTMAAVALNIIGLVLGVSAQLMKAWVVSRGG